MLDSVNEIWERAKYLSERIAFNIDAPPENDYSRWIRDEWIRGCANGDKDRFARRLERLGLTELTWRSVLRPFPSKSSELSDWVTAFSDLLQECIFPESPAKEERSPNGSGQVEGGTRPFAEAFEGIVQWAEKQLVSGTGVAIHRFSEPAKRDLVETLVDTLCTIASRVFVLELNVARVLGQLHGSSPEMRYNYFVQTKLTSREGWLWIFTEYPVLARLLTAAVQRWIKCNTEFVERLERDWPALISRFFDGLDPGQVERVRSDLSDPHCGGYKVCSLKFRNGQRLIYKPKNIAAECSFQELLAWFNAAGAPLDFRILRTLDREQYGYVEYVESSSCAGTEEIHRFYQRSGMYLSLVYVLQATDFHNENVIACGEYPVLIDLEAILHPRLLRAARRPPRSEADALASELIESSVMRTGMLPSARFGERGMRGYDTSGLGGVSGQKYPRPVPIWSSEKTDEMHVETIYAEFESRPNRPTIAGSPVAPSDFAEDVVKGFRSMYDLIRSHRADLLSGGTPLHQLQHVPIRFIVRPTQAYFDVLYKSFDPAYLRDGLAYSICMEILCRAVVDERFWPLVEDEIAQLLSQDIPLFHMRPSENFTTLSNGAVVRVSDEQPWHSAVRMIHSMGEEDRTIQERIIRASLQLEKATEHPAMHSRTTDVILSPADCIAIAEEVARDLCETAILGGDGSVTWIAPEYIPEHSQFRLQPMSVSLYGGKCGVALFFAALHMITGNPRYRAICTGSLKSVVQDVETDEAREFAKHLGIGGMSGVGSLIYSLVRCGVYLRADELIDHANDLTRFITPELIEGDSLQDFVGGAAGCVLALLHLHRQRPLSGALGLAISCGQHLIKSGLSRLNMAPVDGHERRIGFAHGVTGLGYALHSLWNVAGDRVFEDAAAGLFAKQREWYSKIPWRDVETRLGRAAGREFLGSWCYGFTGMGLAQIAMLGYGAESPLWPPLDAVITDIVNGDLLPSDHLCCGNSGKIDLLLEACSIGRKNLQQFVFRYAAEMYSRRKETGAWRLSPQLPPGMSNPGLMRGSAGIGYEFLRLLDPSTLTSVLLLR